ncbi:MAG TPA: ATPase, T2SS/T4P/T4SS family, partial [Methanoregulaceae archaeon]|nr:ATPase, T2SS/T4P/T4SS family [Methanoregulaceae archaeon]
MKLVPDTSVIIDGRITSLITRGEYPDAEIIIPEAVVAELESQANQGREIGFSGLAELQQLCRMAAEGQCTVRFVGERPSFDQVRLAAGGEIDAMIRAVAIEHRAIFLTSDRVQSEVARAKGLEVQYLRPEIGEFTPLGIDQFFDEQTLAVYLKENVPPYARRGSVQDARLVRIRDQPSNEYELVGLAQEILERAKRSPDGFIEHESRGITIVQIGSMRIAIARSPFVDGMEITAVRPVVDISFDEYDRAEMLKERLTGRKGGILIAGMPGSGKTTLAQNCATFLSARGFIIKTMEAPRDMQVPDLISQYTALDGSMEATAEMVMLLRPDYVVYDELRRTEDFRVFADMRLAGVGMIGVLHAENIHAVLLRFLNRLDFGTLSRVIDTIVIVEEGEARLVYDLQFGLRAPDSIPSDGT